jgi:hypothetical protein
MTIPSNVHRVSILGTGPGAEVFNVGFWINGAVVTTAGEANTLAGLVRDAWQTNAASNWKGLILPDSVYREIRWYAYPTGGPNASVIGSAAIVSGTGTGTGFAPLQQCAVVSLRTGFAGRRTRGRMYVPASGAAANTGHLYASSVATNLANSTAAFFTAVNAMANAGPVSVLSQVGAGSINPVTEVRVDDKPDIQRRRANKFAAASVAVATVS